jgi:hypothetical protein
VEDDVTDEERESSREEFLEFLDMVRPAVDDIQEYFDCTPIQAFQGYVLLGIISEMKTFRANMEGGEPTMKRMSPRDFEMFMEMAGDKPN